MTFLFVALGGMAGALIRFGLDTAFTGSRRAGRPRFPTATLIVNVAGSLLIGAAFGLLQRGGIDGGVYDAAAAGLAGGLTTFSSWSTATVLLWLDGSRRLAAANVTLNLVLSVCAVALGHLAATG
ncbi:CrcB family protein [Arthrobacter sp. Sa2BUA2]|uniref:Fluoride-specific ion channel FluC n=1 Tax=Arthrobacter pullicola TaxID=2762224 RepID=A0ABR8YJ40_9MICC|nr:CrcB family protein [Arthrobacter pullicola]MBD8044241.1 CrcB family protein [Arthrobacter pullicola]